HPATASAAAASVAIPAFAGDMAPSLLERDDSFLKGWSPSGARLAILGGGEVGPKLLIVEDETALRGVLLRSLRAEGFDAAAVATGRELIERALRSPAPDALMIDIGLPDADGRDVCQALRSQGVQA